MNLFELIQNTDIDFLQDLALEWLAYFSDNDPGEAMTFLKQLIVDATGATLDVASVDVLDIDDRLKAHLIHEEIPFNACIFISAINQHLAEKYSNFIYKLLINGHHKQIMYFKSFYYTTLQLLETLSLSTYRSLRATASITAVKMLTVILNRKLAYKQQPRDFLPMEDLDGTIRNPIDVLSFYEICLRRIVDTNHDLMDMELERMRVEMLFEIRKWFTMRLQDAVATLRYCTRLMFDRSIAIRNCTIKTVLEIMSSRDENEDNQHDAAAGESYVEALDKFNDILVEAFLMFDEQSFRRLVAKFTEQYQRMVSDAGSSISSFNFTTESNSSSITHTTEKSSSVTY